MRSEISVAAAAPTRNLNSPAPLAARLRVANDLAMALPRAGILSQLTRPAAEAVALNVGAVVRDLRSGHRAYLGAEITDYDPLDPATAAQPHQAYRALHAGGRVHYNPRRRTWVLSGYDDVRAALRSPDVLISGEGVTRTRFPAATIATTDGDMHTRLRRQALPAFTKGALLEWQAVVDDLAAELVSSVVADPGCDVVDRLAVPMPMLLIARLLGVPEDRIDDFRAWSTAATASLDVDLSLNGIRKLSETAGALRALWSFFSHEFAAGSLRHPNTVLGRMLAEGGEEPDPASLFTIVLILLVAGNETTTNLLGGAIDLFSREPEHYRRLRDDPELIPGAVEELLRYTSPIQGLYRTARSDYAVGSVTIPAGARVLVSFAAANRDPSVYEQPDEFRLDRVEPAPHLAFGNGVHMCLGAALTRLEAIAVLRELVETVERIDALGDTVWSTNSSLRGPVRLPVRLVPARN